MLKAFTKTYQRGSATLGVLQGVNVEVERGEFLALMRPSGAVTTLLNLIAGIDFPTSGRVIVNGREILSSDEDRLAGLAYARHRLRLPVF